jgi:hypothetical protein
MKKVTFLFWIIILSIGMSCKKSTETAPTPNSSLVISGNFTTNHGYNHICATGDGGVAVVALTASKQLYVAGISASLALKWSGVFDTAVNNAGGICATGDGGVVVVANMFDSTLTKHIVRIRKFNQAGSLVWIKSYRFDTWDGQPFPVRRTADNGFIILATDYFPGMEYPNRPCLFRINANGDSLWTKGLFDLHSLPANDLQVMPDQGYVVAGRYKLLKTDQNGNKQWANDLPMINPVNIAILNDGYFAVTGDTNFDQSPTHTDQADVILKKYNISGNCVYTRVYDQGFEDHSHSLASTTDGGYNIVARDLWENYNQPSHLIRTDNMGKELSVSALPGMFPFGMVNTSGKYFYFAINSYNPDYSCNLLVYAF